MKEEEQELMKWNYLGTCECGPGEMVLLLSLGNGNESCMTCMTVFIGEHFKEWK